MVIIFQLASNILKIMLILSGSNCIYPIDLVPFTRTPLFLIIDSDISREFKVITGAEKGEPIAMLLSPMASLPIPAAMDSYRQSSGSLFSNFLTTPLQAFILLLGFSGSEIEMVCYVNHFSSKQKFLINQSCLLVHKFNL